jgi:hypothetical protein
MTNPFGYFNGSPKIIRLVVTMYVRYPLSLRNVEDLLAERGFDISHETVRSDGTGLGRCSPPRFAKGGSRKLRGYSQWRRHFDEISVKVNGGGSFVLSDGVIYFSINVDQRPVARTAGAAAADAAGGGSLYLPYHTGQQTRRRLRGVQGY